MHFMFLPFLGAQSVEYKNKVWHEDCFKCLECRQPIRTQSFLTKGDDIYCTSCHDKKFAKKCFHCKQVKQNKTTVSIMVYYGELIRFRLFYAVYQELIVDHYLQQCWFVCLSLSPSPPEGSATRSSRGTPSASCATPAANLWQELASLPTRTTSTAWTASRLMWPRSAMAARTQSQVS